MKDPSRINAELTEEISILKKKIKELEQSELKRKKSRGDLKSSEQKFSLAFQHSPIGFTITSFQDGRYLDVNESYCRLSGFSREELIGRSIFDQSINIWDNTENGISLRNILLHQKAVNNFDFRFRRKSGEVGWGILSAAIVDIAGERCIISQALDITEGKRAEEALKESEDRYRGILENILDVYYRSDREGKLIMVSPSGLALLGYDAENDLIGKSIYTFYFNPEERDRMLSILREKGSVKDFEVTLKHKDGAPTPVSTSSRYYYDEKGEILGVEGIFHDITERKRTEKTLRLITDNMSDMVRVTDLQGVNLYSSPSHAKVLGYKPEERVGKSGFDIVHPDDLEHLIKVFTEGLINKKPGKVEYRIKHAKGHYVWLETMADGIMDDHGEVTAVIQSSREITERKQAEEALRESEEKHRLIIENSHDIIYTITSEGVFTFVSPSWTSLLGHPVTQVVGKPFQQFLHPDDIAGCLAFLQKSIETGQRQTGVEYRVRHADGSWRWHTTNSVPLMDKAGKIVGFEVSASDFTDRKRAEEIIRRSEENSVKPSIRVQS